MATSKIKGWLFRHFLVSRRDEVSNDVFPSSIGVMDC